MKMDYRVVLLLIGGLVCSPLVYASDGSGGVSASLVDGWEEVEAPASFDWRGETWRPACADGSTYEFYVRKLDQGEVQGPTAKKVLLYLEQGGACWTYNTCVRSLIEGFPTVPTYTPAVVPDLGGITTGIFADNPDNPVKDFTHQVVVKYCSGDLHWGSADCVYPEQGDPICGPPDENPVCGVPNNAPGCQFPALVRHRGYDNLMAVLKYLEDEYGSKGPDQMLVFGSSAGGYGVRFAHAAVREKLWAKPRVKVTALADSAMGVVDDSLLDLALGGQTLTGGVWGVERTAPEFLKPALASPPAILPILVDVAIARQWPYDRDGSYTSAFDTVQALFFYITRNETAPELWLNPFLIDPAAFQQVALEWSIRTRIILQATGLLNNDNFYLGSGSDHIILVDPSDPRIPSTRNLYLEESGGIPLTDWIADMIDRKDDMGYWQNLSCAPYCLE